MPVRRSVDHPQRTWLYPEDFDREKLEGVRAERRMREERFAAQMGLLKILTWAFLGLAAATLLLIVLDAIPALPIAIEPDVEVSMAKGIWGETAGLLAIALSSIYDVHLHRLENPKK